MGQPKSLIKIEPQLSKSDPADRQTDTNTLLRKAFTQKITDKTATYWKNSITQQQETLVCNANTTNHDDIIHPQVTTTLSTNNFHSGQFSQSRLMPDVTCCVVISFLI